MLVFRLLLLRLLTLLGLLALLRGLLLRCLVVRVRLTRALGVSGVGLVIRNLTAVRGLIPSLLRLLCSLLTRNLLCARRSRVVYAHPAVLIQGRLVDTALITGLLGR